VRPLCLRVIPTASHLRGRRRSGLLLVIIVILQWDQSVPLGWAPSGRAGSGSRRCSRHRPARGIEPGLQVQGEQRVVVIAYPGQLAHAARHDGLANPVSPVM